MMVLPHFTRFYRARPECRADRAAWHRCLEKLNPIMKTKILSPLFALIHLLAVSATAQVNYAVSGNTAYVDRSPGASGHIVIASTFNGFPVAYIGNRAFEDCTTLTSVTIPAGVTSIEDHAFAGCYSLASATIPNSVTNIGNGAFANCRSLTGVSIPSSVTSIGWSVFYSCTRLTNVIIPDSVTSIGDWVFDNCTGLASVTLPNGVTRIGNAMFNRCFSLTFVTIPNGVTNIGGSAFFNCTGLTNVIIPDNVTSIGGAAFYNCTSLASVTIPSSVTSIGNEAFRGCTSLTSVTIPASVTNIEGSVFSDCTSLTNVLVEAANPAYSSLDGVLFDKAQTSLIAFPPGRGGSYVIPNSVTSIGTAFSGCTSLMSVTIGNSVTNIGDQAFSSCFSLTSATIPNSVTNIGWFAFYRCTSLTNVTIPNSVTSIGNEAFRSCTSLTRMTIPNSVTVLGDAAFASCTNLTNFTFLGNAPRLVHNWHVGGLYQFSGVGAGARAYYYCGTTGWGTNYGGRPPLPTVMLCPPQIAPGGAGVKPGGFGFILTRLTNQTIVVEASANLVNWQPIWTNTLPGASADFVDPQWLQHPTRFYRARTE